MNQLDLLFASLFELLEYVKHEIFEKVPDFMVVINDFCFEVKAGELYPACQSWISIIKRTLREASFFLPPAISISL